ncbi:UNVERIFIED_CONTAM: 1-phosphatidylinositol-3-phosphate 5-kinase FAB1B [Sesamum radiatum]|uniref:1-phosphatidylinositol-3-phosphate 5-kinase n=1 Tax=Sesamum radiatum TaxID=300843 RepID=A0AAW2WI37_SESRA
MDNSDRTVSDLVGLVKSWISWRSEPAHVSRDFWMPDRSCRVCYECDSQFTLFNRRHHCRLCGRIFCAKCTSNWVPTESNQLKSPPEEWDKIRVCNYCFKQWKQGLTVPMHNGLQVASLNISSTSPTETSFLSTKSSTCGSSNITLASLPQALTPFQSAIMETAIERQSAGLGKASEQAVDIGEQNVSQNKFGFCQNRSDDDDEEFGLSCLSSRTSNFTEVNGYYGHIQFDDFDSDYKSRKVHPDGDALDSKSTSSSPVQNTFHSQISEEVQQIVRQDAEHDISEDCEAPSSLYVAEDVDAEPVDFENNGVLWLPPEPEDEEDEREALLFDDDDDDDGDAVGEWKNFRTSSSFGSGESRSRDKSNEEHKKAMKNVVDGHFRALVAQLLQVENLLAEDENDKEGWLEIITALSWEAATLLKPDTSKGGQMDPGGYVKVKCLASGRRSESLVVKGVVCKKNVAHRRMTSKVEKPRLLILGGALEYQRVSNALSSFDTLLQQEMDHLKMAVAKIDAHNPDIVLVEKSVSRHAQEYLLAKNITLVLNIKRTLLERIARCTGTEIVPSIDHLSSQKLGYCDMFHVERFLEEHGSAGQAGKKLVKTLMYFEGCPKPLGCTILLQGANGDELKKVKHVLQYGVFAAYHLALETSFLADEGASLPELPLNSPITVALPEKPSMIDRSISTVPGFTVTASENTPGSQYVGEPQRSNSVPTSDLIKVASASIQGKECSGTYNLPAPIGSQYAEPLLVSSVQGFLHSALDEPSLHHASVDQGIVDLAMSSEAKPFEVDRLAATGDSHISSDLGVSIIAGNDYCSIDATPNASELAFLQPDIKQLPEEQTALKEEFPPSPSDHQSILVSLSSRCVWNGTVCERSIFFGSSIMNYICRSCDRPAEAHVQCYTHRQGTLTISVKKLPEIILPGETDGKIWMWHRCLKCPRANGFPPATRRVVMSDAAWGLSFGKFLELSFSNHAAASRVASCGHSLHRDCLRFYGYDLLLGSFMKLLFGKMVACFRYASIDVHSVYLPPPKLDFNYETQEWIERELNEVVGRAELLFSEVLKALYLLVEKKSGRSLLNSGVNIPESRGQIADLEGMLQKEKSEFETTNLPVLHVGPPPNLCDSLEVENQPNDVRLLSEPIQKPPSDTEKNPYRNAPVQINKFLGNSESIAADTKPEQNPDHGVSDMPNNHSEVSHRGNDVFVNSDHGNQNPLALSDGTQTTDESDPLVSGATVRRALSDGQAPDSLSDTLDAAWTGESHPSTGIPKNKSFSGSVEAHTPSTVRVSDKLDVEDHKDDLTMSKVSQSPSVSSTKGSDNAEDNVSWLAFDEPERPKDAAESLYSMQSLDSGTFPSFHSLDEMLESYRSLGSVDESFLSLASSRNSSFLDPLSHTKALHVRVSFGDDGPLGKVKYTVTCYYAKRFEALRRMCCPSEVDFIRSLSRCKKWGAQVGSRSPTCLAKILGIYQVTSKHLKGGKETKMDVLVMENLLFGRNITRLYDLKGSSRSRYNPDSSGSNKVLLDQNLIEAMPTSPIFVGNKAKRLLERAVWNDTAFLASIDVMDYSLLVGVDEEKHELVLGIIDFMRQYTWDKHLETWVKASGILGGPKNASPTVISPKQYKRRFRKAMTTYFLMVPDQWSPQTIVPSKSQTELSEDSSQHEQSLTSAE